MNKQKLTFSSEESAKDFTKRVGLKNVAIASCCELEVSPKDSVDEVYYLRNYIDSEIRYMHERMDRVMQNYHSHKDGHLPKLTAGQIQRLLELIGAEGDFDIVRPTIWVE